MARVDSNGGGVFRSKEKFTNFFFWKLNFVTSKIWPKFGEINSREVEKFPEYSWKFKVFKIRRMKTRMKI